MILSCSHIEKSFGTDHIIKDCSFHIEEREKAAIIGINGAGKSTLLKIIVGEIPADNGTVTIARDTTLGYLAQHQSLNSDNTILEEVMSTKQDIIDMEADIRSVENAMKDAEGDALEALLNKYTRLNHEFEMQNGYAYKSEVTGVLKGLGFSEDDFSLPVNTLSGGQKTRIALSKLLLSKPDIIVPLLQIPRRLHLRIHYLLIHLVFLQYLQRQRPRHTVLLHRVHRLNQFP